MAKVHIKGRPGIRYYQLAAGSMVAAVPVPGNGTVVMIQAEAQNVRYRADGEDPTAAVGVLLAAGESHTIDLGEGTAPQIRVIQTAGGAILNVTTFA